MALSRWLIALGNWIERHFPEKLTAAEVRQSFRTFETDLASLVTNAGELARTVQELNEVKAALERRVQELEKKAEVFISDMNKTKLMLIAQRQTGR